MSKMEFENVQYKNVSYLHARDPSIIAWNRHGLNNVRVNLLKELDETEKSKASPNHIQIYLRIKSGVPFESLYEISAQTLICKVPEGSHALRNIKDGDMVTKKFSFSRIFGPETTQVDLFNSVVKPKLLDFINGRNSTLLTYGASGAGKTFTIVGTSTEPGLVPRALEYLFRTVSRLSNQSNVKPQPNGTVIRLNEMEQKEERRRKLCILNGSTLLDKQGHIKTYRAMQQRLSQDPVAIIDDVVNLSVGIWVSFAEIYNECIYDLLQPDPPRGKQRVKLRLACSNGQTYIKNLNHINVTSGIEAYQILQYGLHNLNYAATLVNSHSSRSHSIFSIKFVQASDSDGGVSISSFNFCDLAGSERLKKTLNVGDRLKESNNINTSLLVLGKCISSIRTAQKQNDNRLVPFRESKLTQLFQKALSGLEDICMIVNMNPCRDMFDESQHVLNFSAIAKDIIVEEQPIVKISKRTSRFSQYMQGRSTEIVPVISEDAKNEEVEELHNKIAQLYDELDQQRIEHEDDLMMNRNQLIQGYKEILAQKDKLCERRLNSLKEEYERKLELMKNEFERKMNSEDIINLDSSTEDDNQELLETVENMKAELVEKRESIHRLQQEYIKLQAENETNKNKLNETINKLKHEIGFLRQENHDLQLILRDAKTEYIEVQELYEECLSKNKQLRSELLKQQEAVSDVELQLAAVTQESSQKTDLIEELEDVKEKYLKLVSVETPVLIKHPVSQNTTEWPNIWNDHTVNGNEHCTETSIHGGSRIINGNEYCTETSIHGSSRIIKDDPDSTTTHSLTSRTATHILPSDSNILNGNPDNIDWPSLYSDSKVIKDDPDSIEKPDP